MIRLSSSRDNNWFGRRLKAAREAARLSQEELGERVDLTRLTIARYESGKLRPNFERLEPLAQAVAQPLWWFFTEQDELPRGSATFEQLCREVLHRLSVLEEWVARGEHHFVEIMAREDSERYTADFEEATRRGHDQEWQLLREAILEILKARFGELSPAVALRLQEIEDPCELRRLATASALARDLSTFLHQF